MRTKTIVLTLTLILFTLGSAQAQIRDETILTYQVLTEEWDDLIAGVLDLSEEEGAAFWPLYEEYSKLKGALWAERIDVIAMFLTGYDTMGRRDCARPAQRHLRDRGQDARSRARVRGPL